MLYNHEVPTWKSTTVTHIKELLTNGTEGAIIRTSIFNAFKLKFETDYKNSIFLESVNDDFTMFKGKKLLTNEEHTIFFEEGRKVEYVSYFSNGSIIGYRIITAPRHQFNIHVLEIELYKKDDTDGGN